MNAIIILNKDTKKPGNKIYLCYKRNNELPKKILINNIELFYNNATKVSLGLPEKLDEIIVNSASITKKIETTIIEEKNLKKSLTHIYLLMFLLHFYPY